MMKLKAALLLDNLQIKQWQEAALKEAENKIDLVLILNCKNTSNKKNIFKNFLYYILNILSLKNSQTKTKKFHTEEVEVLSFDSSYDGMWQSIPKEIYKELAKHEVDFVIKFGMGLLKINENKDDAPFLSYHHGDPSCYRGRPAGFYEILNDEPISGIIVQQLSNELDAGKVYAFAESKVVNYSYKQTSINFYSNSKYLLSKAIDNFNEGNDIKIAKNGKNYRLPSNIKVFHFFFKVAINALKKLLYGVFYEKKWEVAICQQELSFKGDELISSSNLKHIPIEKGYSFYADPFFSSEGDILRVEALNKNTGVGEILEVQINALSNQRRILSGGHFSYPFSFKYINKEFILPEVAGHSSQFFTSSSNVGNEKHFLKGLEGKRLIDATLYFYENHWYLFFGEASDSHGVLHLWIAESLNGNFSAHPKSPVSISPEKARMGGGIIKKDGYLLRLGQNNSRNYGESLSLMKISKLTPLDYHEKKIGNIYFESSKGPHTIDINRKLDIIAFDHYQEKFSLFAGIRRLKAKLKKI